MPKVKIYDLIAKKTKTVEQRFAKILVKMKRAKYFKPTSKIEKTDPPPAQPKESKRRKNRKKSEAK